MRIASLSLLTVCCLLLAVAPVMADTILYSNGPYNGTNDAWTINFGFSVSDSFNVGSDPHVKSLSFVYWDGSAASPSSDLLTTVDMQLGTTSFGGSTQTLSGVTNTFLSTNQFGYSDRKWLRGVSVFGSSDDRGHAARHYVVRRQYADLEWRYQHLPVD